MGKVYGTYGGEDRNKTDVWLNRRLILRRILNNRAGGQGID
jgi:hypothetical protein